MPRHLPQLTRQGPAHIGLLFRKGVGGICGHGICHERAFRLMVG
jgi:hypothetical protein